MTDAPLFAVPPVKPTRRRPLDFYETPLWATRALLRRVRVSGTVFEPCSGDGAIANALKAIGLPVITNDIDKTKPTDLFLDVTREWPLGRFQWVVSNLPFSAANLIVPRAHAMVDNIAVLLRLTWLEPTDARQDFLLVHPPDGVIVLPRYSYTQNGKSDSVTSAWFVWSKEHLILPGVSIVSKRERDALSL